MYTPEKVDKWEQKLKIYFENFIDQKEIEFVIKGEAINVPISSKYDIYDMKICLLGEIYKNKLIFFNKSDKPSKLKIKENKLAEDFVEFNPRETVIQGNSFCQIQVKIFVDPLLLKYCDDYIDDGILKIPYTV